MYTVLIGLLPILLRLLLTSWGVGIAYISTSDFIAFGFILHISILNEIEHVVDQKSWKTIQNGLSIFAIFVYGAFSCGLMLHEAGGGGIDLNAIRNTAIIASVASLLISLTVFYRPNQILGARPCT